MDQSYSISRVGGIGELRGEIDIDRIAGWVDVGIVLERPQTATAALSAATEKGGSFCFGLSGPNRRVWKFSEAATARLEVDENLIRQAMSGDASEIVIDGLTLQISISGGDAFEHTLKLRLALVASEPALPRIAQGEETLSIDLERDVEVSELRLLARDFPAPPGPSLSRPPAFVRVEAQATDARGQTLPDLLRGLEAQLLKVGDQRRYLAFSDGRAAFELAYDAANRRFDPEGLVVAIDAETLVRAARGGLRDARLRFEFFAGEHEPFSAVDLVLQLKGNFADRIVARWLRPMSVDKPVVHILAASEISGRLPDLPFEAAPDGSFTPSTVVVALRIEPKTAEPHVRVLLEGEDLGDLPVRSVAAVRGEWRFDAPIGRWLARLRNAGERLEPIRLEFAIDIEDRTLAKSWSVQLRAELRRAPARPKWIACVDFGASTTAVWLGRAIGEMPGGALALGAWLDTFDKGARGAREDDDTLLPSYIGLDSDFHLRALFDAHSLGDLTLALPGRAVAERRLKKLGYTYDVSVPYPSRAVMRRRYEPGERPASLDRIVPELKRALLKPENYPSLARPVLQRGNGEPAFVDTRKPDLEALLGDVFAELGAHATLRALAREAGGDLRAVAEARDDGEPFTVVVTHPYGVVGKLAQAYRDAGERFADGFAPAIARDGAKHTVVLVPEALAAAQFGIESYRGAKTGARGEREPIDFVTFDIGAGTFDACVLEDRPEAPSWRLAQHFGVALGGSDLDGALVDLAARLLREAERSPAFRATFRVVDDFDAKDSAERRLLLREVRAAKAALNRDLESRRGAYEWRSGDLAIRVGVPNDPGGHDAWPVAFQGGSAPRDLGVGGVDWKLSLETSQAYSVELLLRIAPAYFSSPARRDEPVGLITRALGEEFPSMALSAATARRKVVIVTGRASLWPPLYAALRESARAAGAQMAHEAPLSAREMKEAVVKGAIAVATNPTHIAQTESNVTNPLAMVCFGADVGRGGAFTRNRSIRDIQPLPQEGGGEAPVDLRDAFVVASVMPGLLRAEGREERLRFFERLRDRFDVKPYIPLSEEIRPPPESDSPRFLASVSGDEDRLDVWFRPADGDSEGFPVSTQRQGRLFR